MELSSNSDEEEESLVDGYCHFNDKGDEGFFEINVFGYGLRIYQNPSNREIGHGAVVWDASVVLVKFMEHDHRTFSNEFILNKKVIELGSGCGLAGISFMLRGAYVTFTDLSDVVDVMTIPNVTTVYGQLKSGGLGNIPQTVHPPRVLPLDWTKEHLPPPSGPEPPYDIILLTDCVFSVLLVPDLIRTIKSLMKPRTQIICVHEIRDQDANAAFMHELERDFKVKRIPKTKLHPDYKSDMVEVIFAKPKPRTG